MQCVSFVVALSTAVVMEYSSGGTLQRISDYLVNCVLQHTVPVNCLTLKNDECSLQKYTYGGQTAIMMSILILPTMRGDEQLSIRHS